MAMVACLLLLVVAGGDDVMVGCGGWGERVT
jgi:hypothetical protein